METRGKRKIQMPTDDDDCAAWVMDQEYNVRFISAEELAAMPESITDMINVGTLVEHDGLTISSTLEAMDFLKGRNKTMSKRGFTLIELITVVVVLSILVGGGCLVSRGCGAQLSDNLIVNPLHSSTAKIQVLTTYFASNEFGNIYRVYGNVVEDTDGGSGPETFEIEDSFLDGNYRTADIFGELRSQEQTERIFEVELRGERSGVSGAGSFRQIHRAVEVLE